MKKIISYIVNRLKKIQMTDAIMDKRINNRITRRALIMAIEEETNK